VRKFGTKITKGNNVPLYVLTLKGFIAALYLSNDEHVSNIIDVNYDSLVREAPEIQETAKFLLGFWRNIYGRNAEALHCFFRSPIEKTLSTYNLQTLGRVDLVFYLMEILCGDLLACLGRIDGTRLRESLVRMLEKDIWLIDSVAYAIDWYWTKRSVDLDTICSQVRTALDTVTPALEKCECENTDEINTRHKISERLSRMRRTEMLTRIQPAK
jgi:hypothetical protein